MQRGTADIEVLPIARVQYRESNHVDDQPRRGHDEHHRPGHLDGRDEAPHRFEQDPADDD